MNFTFPYNIAGTATNVVVTVEDDLIAEAKKIGADVGAIEAEAKAAVDSFVSKVTSQTFWGKIKADVEGVVHFVENLVDPAPAPAPPDPVVTPTPVPPTTP